MSEQETGKRISELPTAESLNDADIIPVSSPGGDVYRSKGATVTALRKQLNFINAYDSVERGMLYAQIGQIFHVFSTPERKQVDEYMNFSGNAMLTGNRYNTPDGQLSKAALTAGDKFLTEQYIPRGEVKNGGVFRYQQGKVSGVSVPAGSTGATSYLTMGMRLDKGLLSKLVGCTIKMLMIATASDGFTSAKGYSAVVAQVVKSSGSVVNVGTLESSIQLGNTFYRTVFYTIAADDVDFGPTFQFAANNTAADKEHYFDVKHLTFSIAATPADSLLSAEDIFAFQNQQRTEANVKAYTDSKSISSGELFSTMASVGQVFGGATYITDTNRVIGFSIPANNSGKTSYVTAYLPLSEAELHALSGSTLVLRLKANASERLLIEKSPNVIIAQAKRRNGAATSTVAVGTLINRSQVGSDVYIDVAYQVTPDDIALGQTFMIANSEDKSPNNHYFAITSCSYLISDYVSPSRSTSADYHVDRRIAAAVGNIDTPALPVTKKTVVPTGGGNFTNIKAAMDGINDASVKRPYAIIPHPAVYLEHNWVTKDFIDIKGFDRERTEIRGELPNTAEATEIENGEPFRFNTTGTLQSIKVTARNMRYAVHSDSSGAVKNGTQNIIDCHLEHYGNDAAVNNKWMSQNAWGCGTSSGQSIFAKNSTFIAPFAAFSYHTREYFKDPCYVSIDNCRLITTKDTGFSLIIQPLGSFQPCVCNLTNSELVGDIFYSASPWIPEALTSQPASHAEVKLIGSSNSAAVFRVVDFGRALKIESTDTTGQSRIAVSGDAVPLIFGDVFDMPGAGGIPGYVYGYVDVSGTAVGLKRDKIITRLGQRLGDCSITPKSLNVLVDNVLSLTVTFNKDYTLTPNADVIAEINAVLASRGKASLYAIGERYRPDFSDEQKTLLNTSNEGIFMGMACAYNGDMRKIRKMTAQDDPALFAGIAWEDVYPNGTGRIKTAGYLATSDLLRADAAGLAFGDTLSISATDAGKLVKGGTQSLLTAIKSNAVRVGNSKF